MKHMPTMSPAGGLVTTIRCFRCHAQQTVIGPSSFPTFEHPGWSVDQNRFYVPGGRHFCPEHARRAFVAYCEEVLDCEHCLAVDGLVVNLPVTWCESDVIEILNDRGIRCKGGNRILGVEPVDLDVDADIVL